MPGTLKSTLDDDRPAIRRSMRRALLLAGSALVLLAIPVVLAYYPWRLGRWQILAAAMAGCIPGTAAGWAGPRRGRRRRILAAGCLALAAAALGGLGWKAREREARLPPLWAALDPDSAALTGVLEAHGKGDDGRAGEALLAHFRMRPEKDLSTLPALPDDELKKESDDVLASTFRFFESEPVRLPEDLTWKEDPHRDRVWTWSLHTMPFVTALTGRYRQSGDPRYLERAEDLVLDWIEDNVRYFFRAPSIYSWHDHVTALRVRAWLQFWEPWVRSPLCEPAEAKTFLRAIVAHGRMLADPEFYTVGHNHGMEQDLALLAIGVAFPEMEEAVSWTRLALERLEKQVDDSISPAGIHREHSPGYHLMTLGVIARAVDFARVHGLPLRDTHLTEVLEKMADFAAYMIRPDGKAPLVGDTSQEPALEPDDPILGRFTAQNPVLRRALTRGREGSPGRRAVVYPADGYAIFRDSWGDAGTHGRAFYLFFTAAANRGFVHKQADDMSFIIHARGRDLLVDAGHHSYEYLNPERIFIVSAEAHNVVIVDGQGFSGFETRIEDHEIGEGHAALRASHDNIPGFRHTRTLVHVLPGTVIVIDEVVPSGPGAASGKPHRFEQLFHLAPDLVANVLEGGSTVEARPPGEEGPPPAIRIERLGAAGAPAQVAKGIRDPGGKPGRGWVVSGPRTIEPAPVAVFTHEGKQALFVTRIDAEGELRPGAAPGGQFERDPSTGSIIIGLPSVGAPRRAVIPTRGKLSVRFESP